MNPLQQCKFVKVIQPTSIKDNTSWTTAEVDTKGWDYATLVFMVGDSDIAMASLAVTQANVSATSHANVTGLIVGTSYTSAGAASTLPAAGSDGYLWIFHMDLKNMMRYIDLTAVAGNGTTGTYAAALLILYRGAIGPDTAAEMGGTGAEVLSAPAYA